MKIPSMPETTVSLSSEGHIEIAQTLYGENSIVYFPQELGERIAKEILRLTKEPIFEQV